MPEHSTVHELLQLSQSAIKSPPIRYSCKYLLYLLASADDDWHEKEHVFPHILLQSVPQLCIHVDAQFDPHEEHESLHPKHDVLQVPTHSSKHVESQPKHAAIKSPPMYLNYYDFYNYYYNQ